MGPVGARPRVGRPVDQRPRGGLGKMEKAGPRTRRHVWDQLPDGLPASKVASTDLGKNVVVLDVDASSARVVGYEIGGATVEQGPGGDRRYIPLPETFAVSRAALIVPASVTNFIRDDLSGFGGAVDECRAQLER